MTTSRKLQAVIESVAASDGAGVKLRRSLGSRQNLRFDPFLMLDEFFSDDPDDYLAGFPVASAPRVRDGHLHARRAHAARGQLRQSRRPRARRRAVDDGGARHHPFRDAAADRRPHARVPAVDQPAVAREDEAGGLPRHSLARDSDGRAGGGGELRVIAGEFEQGGTKTAGPIGGLSTAPLYYDLRLPHGIEATIPTPISHNTFLYVYEGDAVVGDDARPLPFRPAGLLTPGGSVRIRAGEQGVRLLLLAGKPIGEPVVQYGPFVMNTPEEIQQAVIDYQRGQLAVAS